MTVIPEKQTVAPEHTAVRVALWRALHLQVDAKPHVFEDEIGLRLVSEEGWRERPDMNPMFSRPMRASIVGRARLIEDLVEAQVRQGLTQYVILGAGLDTFAQRRPEIASKIHIFEIDQAGPQAWKKKRLNEMGYSHPDTLHYVPMDFEVGQSWRDSLIAAGFKTGQSALVVSTGVSMYLSLEANETLFREVANLSSEVTFITSFLLSLELLRGEERASMEFVMNKAKESGTPFRSLFDPRELVALAEQAMFKQIEYISAEHVYQRYFALRNDGLRAGDAEGFLVATRKSSLN